MLVSVPATSANLGPGFDCLGLAVDLRNRVEFAPSRFFAVSIKGEGENNPRLKGNNLFVSIFNEHYRRLTQKRQNFKFTFYKYLNSTHCKNLSYYNYTPNLIKIYINLIQLFHFEIYIILFLFKSSI